VKDTLSIIQDKIFDIRVKGKKPKFVVVDQDTLYKLARHGDPFRPSFYNLCSSGDEDTIYGVRVATVRGSKPFLDVV